MKRRDFLKKAGTGTAVAAGALAAPAIASQSREMTIVSTWPRDFPGLGISAQRLAARITELSEGRINTTYYAAGEKVGAFDSFDDGSVKIFKPSLKIVTLSEISKISFIR